LSEVMVRLRVAASARGAFVRVPTGVLVNPPLCGRTGGRVGGDVVGLMGFANPLSSTRLPYPPTLTHVVLCSSPERKFGGDEEGDDDVSNVVVVVAVVEWEVKLCDSRFFFLTVRAEDEDDDEGDKDEDDISCLPQDVLRYFCFFSDGGESSESFLTADREIIRLPPVLGPELGDDGGVLGDCAKTGLDRTFVSDSPSLSELGLFGESVASFDWVRFSSGLVLDSGRGFFVGVPTDTVDAFFLRVTPLILSRRRGEALPASYVKDVVVAAKLSFFFVALPDFLFAFSFCFFLSKH
jgi:hypothetical protein